MNKTCYFIGVVGAGNQQEDPGERILGGIGNLPGLGALVKREEKDGMSKLFKTHRPLMIFFS